MLVNLIPGQSCLLPSRLADDAFSLCSLVGFSQRVHVERERDFFSSYEATSPID